jgi:hypothetical protein
MDVDTRLNIDIRLGTRDRTYILQNIKFDQASDPQTLTSTLAERIGFKFPQWTECKMTPEVLWTDHQKVQIVCTFLSVHSGRTMGDRRDYFTVHARQVSNLGTVGEHERSSRY